MTDEDSPADGDPLGDPFDRLDDVDREGDPFDHLDDAPEGGAESVDGADGVDGADHGPGTDGEDHGRGTEDDGATGTDRAPEPGTVLDPSDVVDPEELSDGPTERAEPEVRRGDANREASAEGAANRPGGDPLGDLEVPAEDPFEEPGGPFERVDVDRADPDRVWEAIAEDGDDEDPLPPEESRYAEVSKHAYCEGCEHFAAPPAVGCTHETAEIVEFVDYETVRLLDCPVVAERRALEEDG